MEKNRKFESERTLVSIIIPTIKSRDVLTLESIRKIAKTFPHNLEIIIVRGIRPAGKARNIGATKATGVVLLFVDDDVILQTEGLKDFIDKVQGVSRAIVGGVFTEPFTGFTVVGTRLLALHKRDFEALGGFDETLYGWEDHEFSIRAQIRGYKIIDCSHAMLDHHHSRRLSELIWRNLIYERSGTLAIMRYAKYLKKRTALWFFPLCISSSIIKNDLWRNGVTRMIWRILCFYYWVAKIFWKLTYSKFKKDASIRNI